MPPRPTEQNITRKRDMLLLTAVPFAVMPLEWQAIHVLVRQNVIEAMLWHAGSLAILGLLLLTCWQSQRNVRWPALFMVIIACTGFFGALGCALMPVVYYWKMARSGAFIDWFAMLFPEKESEEGAQYTYERILFGLEQKGSGAEVEPFRDLLRLGTLAQKRAVLAKIMRYFIPSYAPLLRQALEDEDNAVRVQAATALAKLEQDYMKRCLALEEKLGSHPHSRPDRVALAGAYEDYANSGIADPFNAHAYRQKAIGLYEEEAERGGQDAGVCLVLARLYRRTGGLETALSYFELYLNATDHPVPEALFDYLETLYEMKDYIHMREMATRYADVLGRSEKGALALSHLFPGPGPGALLPAGTAAS